MKNEPPTPPAPPRTMGNLSKPKRAQNPHKRTHSKGIYMDMRQDIATRWLKGIGSPGPSG